MIVLYQFPTSPFCDKVRRILQFKRVPFRIENMSALEVVTRLRRISSIGKLPCLADQGQIIADSTDIAHHLERRFPTPSLIPRDPAGRGQCHILEDWADESLYYYQAYLRFALPHNARTAVRHATALDPPLVRLSLQRLLPLVMRQLLRSQGLGRKPREQVVLDVARSLGALAELLTGRPYLLGEALTLADIAVYSQVACMQETLEGQQLLSVQQPTLAWLTRVGQATALDPPPPPSSGLVN